MNSNFSKNNHNLKLFQYDVVPKYYKNNFDSNSTKFITCKLCKKNVYENKLWFYHCSVNIENVCSNCFDELNEFNPNDSMENKSILHSKPIQTKENVNSKELLPSKVKKKDEDLSKMNLIEKQSKKDCKAIKEKKDCKVIKEKNDSKAIEEIKKKKSILKKKINEKRIEEYKLKLEKKKKFDEKVRKRKEQEELLLKKQKEEQIREKNDELKRQFELKKQKEQMKNDYNLKKKNKFIKQIDTTEKESAFKAFKNDNSVNLNCMLNINKCINSYKNLKKQDEKNIPEIIYSPDLEIEESKPFQLIFKDDYN